jgi:hypothetical protein
MATAGKRPDPRVIAGIVFLCAGAPFLAVSPGVGVALMAVGVALAAGGVVAARKKTQLADGMSGPPFKVVLNTKGDAVVCVPLPDAETFKEKLLQSGFPCELSADGGVATLNFGPKVDLPEVQRVIDSFTIPPLPVTMGS